MRKPRSSEEIKTQSELPEKNKRRDMEDRIEDFKKRRGKEPPKIFEFNSDPFKQVMKCPLCSEVIAGYITSDMPDRIQQIGTQTIKTFKAVWSYKTNYREIILVFDDGSRHVSQLCSNCLENLTEDPDILEDIYTTAINQFIYEESIGKGSPVLQLAFRVPVGVIK